jgi:hypothetical protein
MHLVHNFCGGCAVTLFNADNRCPVDRTIAIGVNDNRSLAQLVELFLRQLPDRRPSAEEIRALDRLYTPGQRVGLCFHMSFTTVAVSLILIKC